MANSPSSNSALSAVNLTKTYELGGETIYALRDVNKLFCFLRRFHANVAKAKNAVKKLRRSLVSLKGFTIAPINFQVGSVSVWR